MISWFAYVPHAEVRTRQRQGWIIVADLGPVHGHWSVLMRWTRPGRPPGAGEPDARA